jgi:hypothetical protein
VKVHIPAFFWVNCFFVAFHPHFATVRGPGYMGRAKASVCPKGGYDYSLSGCTPKKCTAPSAKSLHAYEVSNAPSVVKEWVGGGWISNMYLILSYCIIYDIL